MNEALLSDDQLHSDLLANAVVEENCRNLCLRLLREVQVRKLFSKYKCKSLFDYATRLLGYSESEANLRITAMWAMVETPEIETKIVSGELSLTNVAKAHRQLRKEKRKRVVSRKERSDLFAQLENKSKKEAEQVITKTLEPNLALQLEGPATTRQYLQINEELQAKLERAKELLFPHDNQATLEDLVNKLADIALKEKDPVAKAKRITVRKSTLEKRQRSIPAATKHATYVRQQECQNCGTTKALEFDHIREFSRGGTHDPSNIQLLCRNCNQRKSIARFGHDRVRSLIMKTRD